MRANTVLRWVHLLFGLLISAYFLLIPDGGWPDWVTTATPESPIRADTPRTDLARSSRDSAEHRTGRYSPLLFGLALVG